MAPANKPQQEAPPRGGRSQATRRDSTADSIPMRQQVASFSPSSQVATVADPTFPPSRVPEDLVDDRGGVRLDRVCDALGIRPAEFATLVGRQTESVANLFRERAVLPRDDRTRSVTRQLLQLVTILRSMSLGEQAPRWMHAPIASYGGKTPVDVLAEGKGQELVSRLLALAAGSVGG